MRPRSRPLRIIPRHRKFARGITGFCLGGRICWDGANNAACRNQDCSAHFPDSRVGDDYRCGNGFFRGRNADIACRAIRQIVHVGWLHRALPSADCRTTIAAVKSTGEETSRTEPASVDWRFRIDVTGRQTWLTEPEERARGQACVIPWDAGAADVRPKIVHLTGCL